MTIFLYPHISFYGGLTEFVPHLLYSNVGDRLVRRPSDHNSKFGYFGYGLSYVDIDSKLLANPTNQHFFIFAIKPEYMKHLKNINSNRNRVTAVVHGTQDLNKDSIQWITDNNWRIITIRKQLQYYFKEKYDLDTEFRHLPFYPYATWSECEEKSGSVSICRIGFDKNVNVILKANSFINAKQNVISIYGSITQPLYIETVVSRKSLNQYYKGEYDREFNILANILRPKKFVIDLTFHANDGGGTQYAFLQAIYNHCCLIIHRKWIENVDYQFREMIEGYNCLSVDNEMELADILNSDQDVTRIVDNSRKLLNEHVNADWSDIIGQE